MKAQISIINETPGEAQTLHLINEDGEAMAAIGTGETDQGSCTIELDKFCFVSVLSAADLGAELAKRTAPVGDGAKPADPANPAPVA